MGRPRKTSNKVFEVPNTQIGVPPGRKPEPVVEVWDPLAKGVEGQPKNLVDKSITFFSRFREDMLVMVQAYREQVGPQQWITRPAKAVSFRDRAFVTNDVEKIEFIRRHPRFGIEIFEAGSSPEHDKRIAEIDDAGRIIALERLGRLGRMVESKMRRGIAVG